MMKILKDHFLNLDIALNLKQVNFLDITFDLIKKTYHPDQKVNN